MGLLDRFRSGKDKDEHQHGQQSGTRKQEETFTPPPGPPPGYSGPQTSAYPQQTKSDLPIQTNAESEYAPPPGPPPSYHNWQSIPDTSLLPPPPAFAHGASSTSNADAYLARTAWVWTDAHPPFRSAEPQPALVNDVKCGNLSLRPPEHAERGETLSKNGNFSIIKTIRKSKDHCYLSSLPLYFEHVDSPFRTERSKIIYYEIKISRLGQDQDGSESSAALGYCVAPYPTWRMPGWQRGSLAVHADDGARYMSHDGGGADFTTPILAGETVGLGLRFSIPEWRPETTTTNTLVQPLTGEVFFTRNGRFAGGWNIQEGLDKDEAWRADFLDGKWDLYAAIGTYGEVEISVNFGGQNFEYDLSTFTGI